jgi:TPR repeat protein
MKTVSGSPPHFLGLLCAVFWLGHCRAHAVYTSDASPVRAADTLSTNWVTAAKAALPAKYLGKELTFQQITNLLCRESERGNSTAQGLWGFVILVQSRSPEAANAGLALLRSSAEKGWVPAMLQLGSLFGNGTYVNKDYQEAFHWFGLAADRDNPEALLELGGCYHYGLGTTQNCSIAATCYRRSAEQTNYVAMKSLGFLLMNGLGVEQDSDAAKYWFTRAAKEGGNRRAMYNLGGLASRGLPRRKPRRSIA